MTHLIESKLRPAVRPAAGGALLRVHHRAPHLRVVGLSHPHAAQSPGRHDRPSDQHCDRGRTAMIRRLGYHWHLRRIMAAHNIWKTTELIPLVRERASTCPPRRSTAWSPTGPSASLCRSWPRSATSSPVRPPTSSNRMSKQIGASAPCGEAAVIEINADFRPERARIIEDRTCPHPGSTPPIRASTQPVCAVAPATPPVGTGPRASSASTACARRVTAREPVLPAVTWASSRGSPDLGRVQSA